MSIPILPITVVIPVKNEERNLPRCLAALSSFAEIIVVDSGSTDRTQEIASASGAKVLDFCWDGRFPKKRNWVLMTHALANPWVLFIDADEIVTEQFCREVDRAVRTNSHCGFWLNYTNYFLGQRLKYGVRQRKLALFRVGKALYEQIDEDGWTELDMEIHEHPIVEGSVGEISSPIEHNDFRGIKKFIDRHRNYAAWEAQRVLLLERQGKIKNKDLTDRQRFKYTNLERWWYPWIYFFYAYVARLGLLDRAAGFYYAFYKAWYFLTIRLAIKELRAGVDGQDAWAQPKEGRGSATTARAF